MRAAAIFLLLALFGLLLPTYGNSATVEAEVADAFMELHTGPGRGYPVFHVFDRGERFRILARRTDWFRVRGPRDVEGWVPLEQLRRAVTPDGRPLDLGDPDVDDFRARRWEAGALFGDFGGANVISVYGGRALTRNLSVELWASEITGRFSDGWMLAGNLVHQPFPEWRISPFATLGTGVIRIDPKATLADSSSRTDQFAQVGVGLRMHLGRRFMLRAEYKGSLVFTNRNENEAIDEWKAGFAFFF